jgi:hypothetical protein
MSDRELTKALSQISFVGLVALDEILAAGGERPGPAMAGDPAARPSARPCRGVRGRRGRACQIHTKAIL